MIPTIDYYISSEVHLSLAPYYNKGVTPQEAKECIESIYENGAKLWCVSSGVNNNWIVKTRCRDSFQIECIVWMIQDALDILLKRKNGK